MLAVFPGLRILPQRLQMVLLIFGSLRIHIEIHYWMKFKISNTYMRKTDFFATDLHSCP